jgi:hypothetical protein
MTSGDPVQIIATVFILTSPSVIVIWGESKNPMTVWAGGGSSFEGLTYKVSEDKSYFSILVDGTTRIIRMALHY